MRASPTHAPSSRSSAAHGPSHDAGALPRQSRRRTPRLPIALALLAALAAMALPLPALARPGQAKVEVTRVDVPDRADKKRLERLLRAKIKRAASTADFGKAKKVAIRARLIHLRHERRGDVLRIHCSIGGRLEGGEGARSRLRFGGRPENASKLERQVIEMVAQGLVARLAELASARASAEERKKKRPEAAAEQALPPARPAPLRGTAGAEGDAGS